VPFDWAINTVSFLVCRPLGWHVQVNYSILWLRGLSSMILFLILESFPNLATNRILKRVAEVYKV